MPGRTLCFLPGIVLFGVNTVSIVIFVEVVINNCYAFMKTQLILFFFLFCTCHNAVQSQELLVAASYNSSNKSITYTVKNQTNDSIFIMNCTSLISNYGDVRNSYVLCSFYDANNKRLDADYWPLKFTTAGLYAKIFLFEREDFIYTNNKYQ